MKSILLLFIVPVLLLGGCKATPAPASIAGGGSVIKYAKKSIELAESEEKIISIFEKNIKKKKKEIEKLKLKNEKLKQKIKTEEGKKKRTYIPFAIIFASIAGILVFYFGKMLFKERKKFNIEKIKFEKIQNETKEKEKKAEKTIEEAKKMIENTGKEIKEMDEMQKKIEEIRIEKQKEIEKYKIKTGEAIEIAREMKKFVHKAYKNPEKIAKILYKIDKKNRKIEGGNGGNQ